MRIILYFNETLVEIYQKTKILVIFTFCIVVLIVFDPLTYFRDFQNESHELLLLLYFLVLYITGEKEKEKTLSENFTK